MRILVIGGGSIGKRHIRNLQTLGYHDIYCLKRNNDKKFAEDVNVGVITNYTQMAKHVPDVVFICNPTSLHIKGLKYAISVDAHIFMEKPLIHNRKGLSEARNLLSGYNGTFFIGFMLRYHPLVQKIKQILDDSLIGEIYNARFEFGSFLPFWHPNEDYKINYAARSDLGGGVINTITHEVDLIQYFFGEPELITCRAASFSMLGTDVEEQCEAIFEYPDNQISLHLDYLQKDYERSIRILGVNGKIRWNWHDNYLELKTYQEAAQKIHQPDPYDINQLYLDEIKDFFSLIDKKQFVHGLDQNHAIANSELILAMHDSHKTKSTVYPHSE